MIKSFSIFFVAAGIIGLLFALFPTLRICHKAERHYTAWRVLGAFIMFFVIGYITFFYLLLNHDNVSYTELLIALVLFGGSIFVALVVRRSLHSIEELQEAAKVERHHALHDGLTDLPNRTLLHERIDQAILDAKRSNTPIAVLLMDLDRFKEINDTLGHYYGDYVLQLIAPRLRSCIRESDTIARLGGDEFAVVLPGVNLEKAAALSNQMVGVMEESFQIEGNDLHLDISIGIAMFPEHGLESDTLLQHADVAMYVAKRSEGNYAVYDAAQDEYSMNRLMLTVELRKAVEAEQLVLHYQPKFSLAEQRVCGVEALIRWQHPDHGDLLPPNDFIPVAEQTGLIRPLTYWVLDTAFGQFSRWLQAGYHIPIAINLSAKNLHDGEAYAQIRQLLTKWEIDAHNITLEITESSMMADPDRAFRVIEDLHSLGIQFAIDDFGTGYSSLAYLKRLPASEVKIDKSFVMDMIADENDRVIVKSTIDLANNMGLRPIAEGVEGKDIMEKLLELGCETVQGFYLCRPLPPDEVLDQINRLNGR